jgi:hypothetical protein
LIGTCLFAVACGGPTYIPDITVSPENRTIDAIAEFHSWYPAPQLLSGKERIGLASSSDKPTDVRQVAAEVESALLEELQSAGIFTRVSRYDPDPDIIVSGRINALHEHYRPQAWTYLPYVDVMTWLFDVKTHVSSGKADLTLYVLKANGELVGTYHGSSKFYESFHPTKEAPPGARLNQALSDAVRQIHDKLLHDAQLKKIASR